MPRRRTEAAAVLICIKTRKRPLIRLLAAEADWRGIDLKEMATLVKNKSTANALQRAEIELKRLETLAKIDAANSHEEITAVLGVIWPDQKPRA